MRRSRNQPITLAWLLDQCHPIPFSGCWAWFGPVSTNGYARTGEGGVRRGAHVVAWELQNGPVPAGLDLDHLCRVRCCINPDHLEPVTRSENNKRGLTGRNFTEAARTKTHCPQGHPYEGANLYRNPKTGVRHCRTCRQEWDRKNYNVRPTTPKVTCKRGHPYSGDNLRLDSSGTRYCVTCRKADKSAYAARIQAIKEGLRTCL